MIDVSILLILFLAIWSSTVHSLASEHFKFKVCHNKHCVKMGGGENLLFKLENLVGNEAVHPFGIELESSGCISECGKGPNVKVNSNAGSLVFRGIQDVDAAADMLKNSMSFSVPPLIIAACNIMERVDKLVNLEEKEKLLSSVVSALENDENIGQGSKALASCLLKRANVRLMLQPPKVEEALVDSRAAASIWPENSKVWRVLSEAEELNGNLCEAIEAVSRRAAMDPSLKLKCKHEVQRLRTKQKP